MQRVHGRVPTPRARAREHRTRKAKRVKEYTTEVNGVETTVLLSDEDAEAQGLSGGTAVDDVTSASEQGPTTWSIEDDEKQADEPATKKATAKDK